MLDPARRDREDDEAGREVRSDRVTTRQGAALIVPASGARRQSAMVSGVHVLGADHPSFRAAPADDAAQKHAALVAADTVLMAGHVTTDPAPHRVLPQCIRFAPADGKLDAMPPARRERRTDVQFHAAARRSIRCAPGPLFRFVREITVPFGARSPIRRQSPHSIQPQKQEVRSSGD
jgi:hypothetical protein